MKFLMLHIRNGKRCAIVADKVVAVFQGVEDSGCLVDVGSPGEDGIYPVKESMDEVLGMLRGLGVGQRQEVAK